MSHPALAQGRTAVITGGASGIGLAVAVALARRGMRLVLGDLDAGRLEEARAAVQDAAPGVEVVVEPTDVARPEDLQRLKAVAYDRFGEVNLLMNNAATGMNPGKPWEDADGWRRLLEVNLNGPIHGVQAFVPAMLEGGTPGLVVNTGSKQGITLPPGNSAYNVSKAGLKAFTELLAHELRTAAPGRLSAHLLIPGWTYTGMTRRTPEKPEGAWTAEQVADFMIDGIERGDVYLLCPDNDTPRRLDERRIAWAAGDLIENRPALSRWHPDYADAFQAFVRES
jgi:NAD(P)-dependent dehydrogenase (short-subunit alcohol dehydrogenase family)